MSFSYRRALAATGVALGAVPGIALATFGVYMLSGLPLENSSHPLDGVVPIVGMISLFISILWLALLWRLARPLRRRLPVR